MTTIDELVKTLRGTLGYEVRVKPTHTDRQLRFLGRLPANRLPDWLSFVHHMYVRWLGTRDAGWTIDISKVYFVGPSSTVLCGWRLIFQPTNTTTPITQFLQDIITAVQNTPLAGSSEVTSMPLVGSNAGRPLSDKGKGAGLEGTVPVGPLAVRRGR